MKSAIRNYISKVKRFFLHLRLRPIRVLLFHQVSDTFDESTMKKGDWTNIDEMKAYLMQLTKRYTFISIDEAYNHIIGDKVRTRRYAVLTSDDGWASLKNILPWLNEQRIPVALFVNPRYFDGSHYREKDTEKYLSKEELERYVTIFPNISVGLHGLEHIPVNNMDKDQLKKYIQESILQTQSLPNYVPYWAYTWGIGTKISDEMLHANGIVPVYIDSEKNWNDSSMIHRELLDEGYVFNKSKDI